MNSATRDAPNRERGLLLGLLGRLGVQVKREEGAAVWLLFSYSLLLGVFQFSGKAVRQASYVDQLGAAQLPFVFLLVAVVAYPVLRIYERAADRWHRDHLVIGTLVLAATGMIVFWWLMRRPSPGVSVGYYLWIALATALTLTQLWSYVNHLFDARQARRLFGLIGAGSLLGGVLGGQITRWAGSVGELDVRHALLFGAATLLLCAGIVRLVERRAGQRATLSGRISTAFVQESARPEPSEGAWTPHVRVIAIIMFLTVIVAEIVDLQFNWMVEQATGSLSERAAAFGNFYSIMGLAAFVFQLVFTSRIHRSLGVGFAMRVLPLFVFVSSAVVALGTVWIPLAPFFVVGLLKVGDNGLRYSLDHATRELLFVPVPVRHRAAAKATVDVFVHRFAKGVGAILLLSVTFGWIEVLHTAWLALALTSVWLMLTVSAQRHYIRALRSGLGASRNSVRDLDTGWLDPNDVTTLEVLVESLGSADPQLVVHSIDLLRGHGRSRLIPPLLLHHADREVRLRTLRALMEAERRDALPLIESKLTDPDGDVRVAAVQALARLTQRGRIDLMRPRLGSADPRVRAAAISSLAACGEEDVEREALVSLDSLIADDSAAARMEAARVLGQIDEPRLQERLIRLLYDADRDTVRVAIGAVRQRRERSGLEGANPLYAPILISLLRDRRLKHDARETLAAFGEPVLPALQHFMDDRGEHIWVRRAIPKTIALLGTPAARDVLYAGLEANDDRFLRRKVIEALMDLRHLDQDRDKLRRHLREECEHCAGALVALVGLSRPSSYELDGPLWRWLGEGPCFVQRLVDERRQDHLRNAGRLLVLLEDRRGARGLEAALEYLRRPEKRKRGRALEFLDNVLGESERRLIMPLIDDLELKERLVVLERQFSVRPRAFEATLMRLVQLGVHQPDFQMIGAAALAEGFRRDVDSIRRLGVRLREREPDDLYGETARWLERRVIA